MSNKRILIFASHPDDEVLGCGGTIAFHRNKNDHVAVCYLSEGVSARFEFKEFQNNMLWENDMIQREKMALKAASILDFEIIEFLRLPNLRMQELPLLDLTKNIISIIKNFKPNTVYVNFPGDLNTDHRITFDAVFTALRPASFHNVSEILCYEVLSSTEWAPSICPQPYMPNMFVDISKFIDVKLEAINAYEFEMRPEPHPRSLKSIRSLAIHRGSQIGVNYAESFVAIRKLIQ